MAARRRQRRHTTRYRVLDVGTVVHNGHVYQVELRLATTAAGKALMRAFTLKACASRTGRSSLGHGLFRFVATPLETNP